MFDLTAQEMSSFDKWYAIYPMKKARVTAEKAWQKLNPNQAMYDVIMSKTMAFVESYKREGKEQFLPHPATFLNQRRWEDQLSVPKASPQPPVPTIQRPVDNRKRMFNGAITARSSENESVEENCRAFNRLMEDYGSASRDYNF